VVVEVVVEEEAQILAFHHRHLVLILVFHHPILVLILVFHHQIDQEEQVEAVEVVCLDLVVVEEEEEEDHQLEHFLVKQVMTQTVFFINHL
jgi:hypothetical protein